MQKTIFHITTKNEWQTALENGFYKAKSLDTEGFIHCSTKEQVEGVLQRYFENVANKVILEIDTSKLKSKLENELSPSINEKFPHIYGVINLDAVTLVNDI